MNDRSENIEQFVHWFRQSSPYINAHRGRTFVVYFGGDFIQSASSSNAYTGFIHDLVLLNALGVRLVLIHGAEPQIDSHLSALGIETRRAEGLRITDENLLPHVKSVVGSLRMDIETLLSRGVANTPLTGLVSSNHVHIAGGNFVTAQPLGVRNGIDFHHTGEVRRIDTESINNRLADNNIVLLSPLGYSPSGEIFSLGGLHLATETAIALKADKLLVLGKDLEIKDTDGESIHQMNLREAEHRAKQMADNNTPVHRGFAYALHACQQGVSRVHLIDQDNDGALLLELFTRDGLGTLISAGNYDTVRQATIDDIGGILELIEPLEESGVLVRRSRERLEMEIHHFTIMERDGMITAVAALYPFPDDGFAELACLAVHPDYDRQGRGASMLAIIEQQTKKLGLQDLFVLTSRTAHWFVERGFQQAELAALPIKRQELYNYQRRSKVFIKKIKASRPLVSRK